MNRAEKERAFVGLFQENKARVLRLCHGFLGSEEEAEDLFQEIMVSVWNSLETFRGEARLTTWLYRIAVNTALMYRRKRKRHEALLSPLDEERLPPAAAPADTDDNERRVAELRRAIATLAPQDRLIVTLLLEGLAYKEIADITGISVNYVGVKISRIKQLLEKRMTEVAHGTV